MYDLTKKAVNLYTSGIVALFTAHLAVLSGCTPSEQDKGDAAIQLTDAGGTSDSGSTDVEQAPPNTIYVHSSRGVDETGAGSAENPYLTIGYAITVAQPPLQIRVAAGYYEESVVLRPGISLLGGYSATDWYDRDPMDRENPTYQTSIKAHLGIAITAGLGVTENTLVEGFDLHGGFDPIDHHSFGIYLYDDSSPVIRFNTVEGGTGDTHAYGIGIYGSSAVIIGNTIYGGTTDLTYGMIVQNESTPLIASNVILGDSASDISYGILVNNSDPVILSNTISGGSPPNESYALFLFTNASTIIDGNILLTQAGTIRTCIHEFGMNTRPASLSNNNLFACPTSLYRTFGGPGHLTTVAEVNALENTVAADNISVDPNFVSSSDWHLQDSTPQEVRNGGTMSARFYIDHDGTERTAPWSMGAYEYE